MKNLLAQFGLRFTTGHAVWAAALIPACIVICLYRYGRGFVARLMVVFGRGCIA